MKPCKWNLTKNVQLLFEPADLWVGFFYDRIKHNLYFLPVPCLGLAIHFPKKTPPPLEVDWSGFISNTPKVLKESDINGAADSALFKDGRFPHCDPRVLHAPGECEICDEFAFAAQTVRINKSINFTGHSDPLKQPCPADAARGLGNAHVWHGNRPSKT